jgi:hypothetical protein
LERCRPTPAGNYLWLRTIEILDSVAMLGAISRPLCADLSAPDRRRHPLLESDIFSAIPGFTP